MKKTDPEWWQWSRLTTVRWEDAWVERLAFLPPGSLATTTFPGKRTLRLDAVVSREHANALRKEFGGTLRKLTRAVLEKQIQEERRVLSIRDRLVVVATEEDFQNVSDTGRTPLWIPAGLAFGTGGHATTAGCLRLLCDEVKQLADGWKMADLGCGSGILALAGRKLGAQSVFALDYDPICIRVTRENIRRNHEKRIQVSKGDVLAWEPNPGNFQVVTANLFSDVLIRAAAPIARALVPGGGLIFSGVLRPDLPAVYQAFRKAGLKPQWNNARGRWIHGLARLARRP